MKALIWLIYYICIHVNDDVVPADDTDIENYLNGEYYDDYIPIILFISWLTCIVAILTSLYMY